MVKNSSCLPYGRIYRLPDCYPRKFSSFLTKHLFAIVKPNKIELMDTAYGTAAECSRYEQLLLQEPIDIVCLGIGENGHIAFNDPGVADFNDPSVIKVVGSG